jgi:dihydrofolate reductase
MTTRSTTPARRVVANISLSLDGRICGLGGDHDMGWIAPHAVSDGARDHMIAVTSSATTAVMGRKNAQGFGGFWPAVADDEQADPRDRAFSRWLDDVEKVVLSSTTTDVGWPDARVVDEDAATVVAELREQPGGDIVVLASTSVIQALLAADEVDELSITLCPEIVGGGRRLFDDGDAGGDGGDGGDGRQGLGSTSWTLASSEPTASGALCLRYDRIR